MSNHKRPTWVIVCQTYWESIWGRTGRPIGLRFWVWDWFWRPNDLKLIDLDWFGWPNDLKLIDFDWFWLIFDWFWWPNDLGPPRIAFWTPPDWVLEGFLLIFDPQLIDFDGRMTWDPPDWPGPPPFGWPNDLGTPSKPDTPPRIETSRPFYLVKTCLWGYFFNFLATFSIFGGVFIDFGPPIDWFRWPNDLGPPGLAWTPPFGWPNDLGPPLWTWVGYQGRKSIGLRFGPPPIGENLTRPPRTLSGQFSINFRWPNDLGARLRVLVPDLKSIFCTNQGGPDPFWTGGGCWMAKRLGIWGFQLIWMAEWLGIDWFQLIWMAEWLGNCNPMAVWLGIWLISIDLDGRLTWIWLISIDLDWFLFNCPGLESGGGYSSFGPGGQVHFLGQFLSNLDGRLTWEPDCEFWSRGSSPISVKSGPSSSGGRRPWVSASLDRYDLNCNWI